MAHAHTIASVRYTFDSLADLLAKATPARSGDELAGIAATSAQQRVAAQRTLADLPLTHLLNEPIVPYETDEVTRLILDTSRTPAAITAFAPISSLTVGELRDHLLSDDATPASLAALAPGLTPEMAAAVSKLMRLQDLILVARKINVVTKFRTTVGLPGRLSTRLQPNHPTDDPAGIAASILDGLLLGSGDAVIGINPVSDNVATLTNLLHLVDHIRRRYDIPTQSCVLAHLTTQMQAMQQGAPLDLLFQSIGGTEATNKSFGINLALLEEAHQQARSLNRAPENPTPNIMYFETGQGSSLSANAHRGTRGQGIDQQTLEARAYAVARHFNPMLVNTVVGFIGPEYLYDGKQILRASLEDHFCGKLLGLPMGCDICYTNHAEADQDDMDALLTMLGAAGVNYIMGVPGADDIMLHYQSTSFHDALYLRRLLNLRPAPEFESWLNTTAPHRLHLPAMLP
ncbi:ethanolamine ammonia-lyase subunit EutB [Tunturiibacter gelidoferens]|uniref:Ethanolamine ammonia-lyase large subunit n=1 Tax=Tunturiibacter gelidiferens TaxID=3069689 RepID=A0ACC5P4J9_9BACT|nr:ethanolamine ammonia-lyase subunit EutB [Edaphobacter lichenicola]MBB5341768.1 ethanolamine ammonia-lyase large subunit [Edaphobacter lichenicola]